MNTAIVSGRLNGKRALVTAAAQGIGRAIVERLAAEGADVLATDLNAAALQNLTGDTIRTAVVDGTDAQALQQALGDNQFDILVNCIGWVHHGTLAETNYQQWRRAFEVNVDAAYHAISAVLPGMLERAQGSVVTISSAASSVGGFPNRVAYGASKAALIGMTKALAADHVAQGVRFNAICPGTIDTPSLGERINATPDPVTTRSAFIARQPMGRLGMAAEIAALTAYLAADESAFMTGASLVIDGGATV